MPGTQQRGSARPAERLKGQGLVNQSPQDFPESHLADKMKLRLLGVKAHEGRFWNSKTLTP